MSHPETPDDDFLAGFMDDYFAECDEHLTAVRRILLAAEAGESRALPSPDLEELFRSFHSLKGLSGMVALREAEQLAHQMESYLRLLRGRTTLLSENGLDALLRGTQQLEEVIAARREGTTIPNVEPTLAMLERFASGDVSSPAEVVAEEPQVQWRARFTPSPELAGRGVTVDQIRTRLKAIGRIVDATPLIGASGVVTFEFKLADVADTASLEWMAGDGLEIERLSPPAPEVRAEETRSAAATALLSAAQFVRVDLSRLDDLMRLIGDLVISRARLEDSMLALEKRIPPLEWRTVQENSGVVERQLRDLREAVMRVRMVPVGEVFRRMALVVRDLAREAGKKVDLHLVGEHTEIDKYVIERMMDPVLHLVRNAVAHGIESPDARVRAGKPEAARITLAAASAGDVVTLQVSDDGGGVDVGAVAQRARAAGLPLPADGRLEGRALLDVLCAPGFSTRDAADRAAGRGVGMAVVQTTVRELGGELRIDTNPGGGTSFSIELPLTLAITDAIIATAGGQMFAVPQSSIREVIEVDPALVKAIENHEIVPYRGGVLPLVRLTRAFALTERPRPRLHVFVVGQGLGAIGIIVERITGQREIVVRPMNDPLVRVQGVTGATDLGNGRVVLILDLARVAANMPAAPVVKAS